MLEGLPIHASSPASRSLVDPPLLLPVGCRWRAAEEERSWASGLVESEAAVRSALVAALWEEVMEDTERVVLQLEHGLVSQR